MVRLVRIELTLSAPEADALSTELQAQISSKTDYNISIVGCKGELT